MNPTTPETPPPVVPEVASGNQIPPPEVTPPTALAPEPPSLIPQATTDVNKAFEAASVATLGQNASSTAEAMAPTVPPVESTPSGLPVDGTPSVVENEPQAIVSGQQSEAQAASTTSNPWWHFWK